jgi:hypothetical protein
VKQRVAVQAPRCIAGLDDFQKLGAKVAAQIENFIKFPPRQKPASFNLDAVLAMASTHGANA